ncbi:MAG: GTPase Era [Rhodobiaceae bacterium]|jgi:GTP-binding protein Era|nr:GTPase Era [Rhodobiaceae bacterium]MBT5517330.1 GTPase Era [Rhodobiaceae bacterium]MDG2494929.1 GTPase Era [Alphaproteobacteria bacterium]
MTSPQKCGFVAVIGPPNAGKSTLSNALVGQKVAIVTQKAQTTRMRLRAVVMHQQSQIILVDTPGIFEAKQRFDRAMVNEAWLGVNDADQVLVVLDAQRAETPEVDLMLDGLARSEKRVSLVLNKIDTVPHESLLALVQKLNERVAFADTFLISALKGHGLSELRDQLAASMPEGPWLYPEDQAADIPSLLLASEVLREKLFLRLHEELPYHLTVETEKWETKKDGSVRIEQTVYVRRDGQKAIVLGKGGQTMKEIGSEARRELEEMFERRVHLFVFVKVRKNWKEDPERYRMLGLDYKA